MPVIRTAGRSPAANNPAITPPRRDGATCFQPIDDSIHEFLLPRFCRGAQRPARPQLPLTLSSSRPTPFNCIGIGANPNTASILRLLDTAPYMARIWNVGCEYMHAIRTIALFVLAMAAGRANGQTISFVTPSGGEVYVIGQTQTVRFAGHFKTADIELSTDGGATFAKIGSIDNLQITRAAQNTLLYPVAGSISVLCMFRATVTGVRGAPHPRLSRHVHHHRQSRRHPLPPPQQQRSSPAFPTAA